MVISLPHWCSNFGPMVRVWFSLLRLHRSDFSSGRLYPLMISLKQNTQMHIYSRSYILLFYVLFFFFKDIYFTSFEQSYTYLEFFMMVNGHRHTYSYMQSIWAAGGLEPMTIWPWVICCNNYTKLDDTLLKIYIILTCHKPYGQPCTV